MVLSATLASLIVNIILNSRGFNNEMKGTKRNIVQTAAKFYLLRTAVLAAVTSMNRMVSRAGEIEDGFTNIERIAANLRNTTFRSDMFDLDAQLRGINIDSLQQSAKGLARLGIRENLLELSKTISMFSKTAEMGEEQAALILGRMTQLFNLPNKAAAIEELGNSIIEVAENMATSEQEITDVLSRIGPVGQLAGFSVTDLVGIAGAVKAIGQRSEAAGSAVQRLFVKLFGSTDEVIAALDITSAEAFELQRLIDTDVNEAFRRFLGIIGSGKFDRAAAILQDIELSGKRVMPVLLGLSKNTSLLTQAQDLAAKGANENIQILEDYALQMDNLSARTEGLKSAWDELGSSLGNTSPIKGLISDMEALIRSLTIGIDMMEGMAFKDSGRRFDPANVDDLKTRNEAILAEINNLNNALAEIAANPLKAGVNTATLGGLLTGKADKKIGAWGFYTAAGKLKQLEEQRLIIQQLITKQLDKQAKAHESALTQAAKMNNLTDVMLNQGFSGVGGVGGAIGSALNQALGLESMQARGGKDVMANEKERQKAADKAEKEAARARKDLFNNFWDIIKEQGHNKGKNNSLSSLQDFWKNQITSAQEKENEKVLKRFDHAIELAKDNSDSLGNIEKFVKEFVENYGVVY